MCRIHGQRLGARRGDASGGGQVADDWDPADAQVRVLILQGTTDEAEALAAQFLIEPLCCEQTLHLFRSDALRLGGRFDEAARAADQAISIARAKGGLVEWAWLLAWRGLAELDAGRSAQALASAEHAMSLMTEAQHSKNSADVSLAYGRALLANGRAAEALEPLRQSYGFWLGHDPRVGGRPRPSTGSVRPGSPTATPSAGAGWWLKRSARWPSRPTNCTKGCHRRLAGRRGGCAVHTLSGQGKPVA